VSDGQPPSKFGAVIGALTALMGIFVISAVNGAFGPPKSQDAPAWVGTIAGFVFIAGGSIAILHSLSGGIDAKAAPPWLRLSYLVSMLTITGGLALIALWVSFGAGTRSFRGSGTFFTTEQINEFSGRVVFGIGGIMVAILFAAFLYDGIRGFFRRD
jgi:hypothetical protein